MLTEKSSDFVSLVFPDKFCMLEGGWRVGHGKALAIVLRKEPPMGRSKFAVLIHTPIGVRPQLISPLLAGAIYQTPVDERGDFVELLSRIVRAQAGALVVPAPQKG